MNFYKKIIIFNAIALILFLVIGGWVVFKFNQFLNTPASNSKEKVYFEIKKGESVYSIVRRLKDEGLIKRGDWFYYYIRFTSAAKKIKAGIHLLKKDYTPKQILKELENSKIYSTKVRIKEGSTIADIAKLLTNKGFNGKLFATLADNAILAKKLTGLDVSTLEGFMYPDTYYFAKKEKPLDIIYVMFDRFEKIFNDITGRHFPTKDDYKKLIVASIIEKEAAKSKDRPIVASVIYNRLKKGMNLQMDSTLIYGIKDFNGKITKSELKDKKNKYNTYIYSGLPKTPICNPSKDSIKAAYNPAKTNYLFFISDNKSMVFSKTFKEHKKWIKKYKIH